MRGGTSYTANWYVFGGTDTPNTDSNGTGGTASIPKSFPDGQSNTIVWIERIANRRGRPHLGRRRPGAGPNGDLYSPTWWTGGVNGYNNGGTAVQLPNFNPPWLTVTRRRSKGFMRAGSWWV